MSKLDPRTRQTCPVCNRQFVYAGAFAVHVVACRESADVAAQVAEIDAEMEHEDRLPGPEYRDQRMRELERLIALGWGDVPMSVIQRAMAKNNGALPSRVTRGAWNAGQRHRSDAA